MKSFAFVFPGQGSQSVGMLDPWGDHPAVLETLREASDALGEDIGRLIHEGPREADEERIFLGEHPARHAGGGCCRLPRLACRGGG